MKDRRVILAIIIGVVVLGLASLGQGYVRGAGAPTPQTVPLNDGRTVTCITGSGSITCDWEGSR